jgi:hypothetical protein
MSDDGTLWLLAIGPAGGTALYWSLYRYYRNTDKSHDFEHESIVRGSVVTREDVKIDEVKGTSRTRIEGDNVHDYRKRVHRIKHDSS